MFEGVELVVIGVVVDFFDFDGVELVVRYGGLDFGCEGLMMFVGFVVVVKVFGVGDVEFD